MTQPRWFTDALATPYAEKTIDVEGAPIHYLRWAHPGAPGLVLVHGGAAHAHWWTFLAPLFARQYDVVALDLSGHGDSGRRAVYPRETWAREVLAVADDAGFPGPPMLVGHSMGGLVSIVAAALHGDRLAGVIIVDSPVHARSPESDAARAGKTFGGAKTYPDLETAVGRFRLVPSQPCDNDFILDHVARRSIVAAPDGYRWKFDPAVFTLSLVDRMAEYLSRVRCRVALLRGAFSAVVPVETADFMYELLQRTAPLVEIPEAYHHLLLDQPLAFVAATRALLADWQHSTPRRAKATLHREAEFPVPAEEMWRRVEDFYRVHEWLPGIRATERDTEVARGRLITLDGGAQVVEQLVEEGPRVQRYRFVRGPLPLASYESRFEVHELGPSSCRITWDGTLEPKDASEDDVRAMLAAFYDSGLAALAKSSVAP